jgi:hypothetical protein
MYFALEPAVYQVLPPLGCFEHGDAFAVAIAALAGEVTKVLLSTSWTLRPRSSNDATASEPIEPLEPVTSARLGSAEALGHTKKSCGRQSCSA